ncbi:carbamoyltransferase C-terminal domain-containing protein [Crossiella cryophila]|uniref:Carbamoyltransferase n=1 Tax=Crossiella cryophila TaxID=43355 RepID=A0A7W7FVS3_9PSEU|nr:carbamoyltransferase C-terminal domain-containing protein [Crossiella cryophila]MBB4678788.1 carbamoyltransferase [Crossiella cryophila]
MRYYLGLGGSKHDFATCLVGGGKVLAAIEEERITRKKRSYGVPEDGPLAGVRYCLDLAGITMADVDAVFVNDLLEPWSYETLGKDTHVVGHHLAHAASAYYVSGFDSAAVLVADHSGGRWRTKDGTLTAEVVSYYRGEGSELTLVDRQSSADSVTVESRPFATDLRGSRGIDLLKRPGHSLGRFYAQLAKLAQCNSVLGDGKRHTESGKLMGLSAHGTPVLLDRMRACFDLGTAGRVHFQANEQGESFEDIARHHLEPRGTPEQWFARRADVAYAAQHCLEEMVLHLARHAAELTGERALGLAGGTFLNGLANEAVLSAGVADRLFVQPAAHDSGTALGAALLGAARDGNWPCPDPRPFSPLLGKEYSPAEIESTLAGQGVPHRRVADPELVAARAIAHGRVVGRFTGRSEYGPRALGNRSVLADPRDPGVRRTLDERIKYREPYRPYAPAVREADTARYFALSGRSPHMLLIGRATPEAEETVPAVVHLDGTVRVQEVTEQQYPSLHRLLGYLEDLTGVGVVLNTSMNVQGEPIVETPADAVAFLFGCLVDVLIIGDFVCCRSEHELGRFIERHGKDGDPHSDR